LNEDELEEMKIDEDFKMDDEEISIEIEKSDSK